MREFLFFNFIKFSDKIINVLEFVKSKVKKNMEAIECLENNREQSLRAVEENKYVISET